MSTGSRGFLAGCARPLLLVLTSLFSTALLLGAYNWSGLAGPSSGTRLDLTGARRLSASHSIDLQSFGDLSALNTRLLLASHSRVSWYSEKGVSVLQEGEGVYHGVFAGQEADAQHPAGTAWVLSRPHNWRPSSSAEHLLHIDLQSGAELFRVQIPSRFAHDAVRWGNKVYVCSTGSGEILELKYPDMTFVRVVRKVGRRSHVNALAPDGRNGLWALFHGRGESELVRLRLSTGKVSQRIKGFGHKAHGLVLWHHQLLVLDSANCSLMLVNPTKKTVSHLWQCADNGTFAKGLSVVDDVAYFGISPFAPRSARTDPALDCELAAFDLLQQRLLWRTQVPTRGLLNVIAAPQLGQGSPYKAMHSKVASELALPRRALLWWSGDNRDKYCSQHKEAGQCQRDPQCEVVGDRCQGCSKKLYGCTLGLARRKELPFTEDSVGSSLRQRRRRHRKAQQDGGDSINFDPIWGLGKTNAELALMLDTSRTYGSIPTSRGGTWASGVPRMDNGAKRLEPASAGVRLDLLHVDIGPLKAAIQRHWDHIWDAEWVDRESARITGREKNLQRYKPGTLDAALIFSDNVGRSVYRFPMLDLFQEQLNPLLEQILGPVDVAKIMRLQLTLMPKGTLINVHQDSGGYAKAGHRIHVPLIVNGSNTLFLTCPSAKNKDAVVLAECISLPLLEGEVFELNNLLPHALRNEGPGPRLHLVIDIAEREPSKITTLRRGQVCAYVKGAVKCGQ